MAKNAGPVNPKLPHMIHGGDYNPDQWMDTKEIWDEDMRLIPLAGCNAMTVGVFSWTSYEPEEGVFTFEWLDEIMDRLAKIGAYALLATPSGARPAWMSQKYPEVLRVEADRRRNLHGGRHNHCWSSPVYREKTRLINQKLAQRYKDHPALLAWHISNELSGECHCDLCQEKFRQWLKKKYNNDLDELNRQWWTRFWSHTYTNWEQIESPAPHGEGSVHGLSLDWMRFTTDQCRDFMANEIAPLREITPNVPVTTNFMGTYPGLNYWKLHDLLDVTSWDSYPTWHSGDDVKLASDTAFTHDLCRSFKKKPFLLMESTPSMTNWSAYNKLKRPGMHLLSSLQAVAHGSDSVQYFQWRKSRGSAEKFHGAVVDHYGKEDTRVFADVANLGDALSKLDEVVGANTPAETAMIYDWEVRWALDQAQGFVRQDKEYAQTINRHYHSLWQLGVATDIIDSEQDFSGYKLIIAPMLYMIKPGVAQKIEQFVKDGGVFVTTYITGMVNENDLCFLGGFPGPLKGVLGIWSEEIDTLYPQDKNRVDICPGAMEGMQATYDAHTYCELIHEQGAQVLARYGEDFYAGRPAVNANRYGKGRAYYIAFRSDGAFEDDFYRQLVQEIGVRRALATDLPDGVTAQVREDEQNTFVFLQNYTTESKTVALDKGTRYFDLLTEREIGGLAELDGYGVMVLKKL